MTVSPGLLALLDRVCDPVPGMLAELDALAGQLEALALKLPDGKEDRDEYGDTPAYLLWALADDLTELTRDLREQLAES